jgi:hypothetical protein
MGVKKHDKKRFTKKKRRKVFTKKTTKQSNFDATRPTETDFSRFWAFLDEGVQKHD